ncbi:MAG: putative acetylglutamate kinase-like protein [Patescibacteria group bacterium]|nr:MAG: putative acetylglutamate kinase-like protein [Patescibacteria group bacterium]
MFLIKIGGDENLNFSAICNDIASLWKKYPGQLIVVHGASKFRNRLAQQLGIPIRTITSTSGITSYFSDENFMKVFLMAYAGWINKKLVSLLIKNDVKAVGLSGIDGEIWLAERKKYLYVKEGNKIKLITGDLSGKIKKVNIKLLKILLSYRYLPVICSPAVSNQGEILNVDNDAAVFQLVKSLKIKTLIYLISAKGLLKDFNNPNSLVKEIRFFELDSFLNSAEGTMKKKIIYTKMSFEHGLKKAFFGDGRVNYPIRKLLLEQKGTVITL